MKVFVGVKETQKRKARLELESSVDIVRVFDADTFNTEEFLQELTGAGMFGEKRGVVLSRVCEDEKKEAELFAALEGLSKDAPVLLFEDKISAETRKVLKKIITHFEEQKNDSPRFNIFALTDAIASGNKKNAWVEWHKAIAAGQPVEYLLSMVSWQLRNMLVAKHIPQHESDMKPYVFGKAQRAAAKYPLDRLEALSKECAQIQIDARTKDAVSSELLIERLLLSI